MRQENSAAPNLRRREEGEMFRADLSGRCWVRGSGKAFWESALRHASPEQLPTVIAAMEAAKTEGAQVARPARPQLTA
ncbi:MAG TPA: hypothetical protein VGB98_00140 [Pyrinomonadaceae bacterium]|jgi:hypothetical protein